MHAEGLEGKGGGMYGAERLHEESEMHRCCCARFKWGEFAQADR